MRNFRPLAAFPAACPPPPAAMRRGAQRAGGEARSANAARSSRPSRRVTILGSTGSIGRAALEVISRLPGVRVAGLAANRDIKLLERQARSCGARFVAVNEAKAARELSGRLGRRIKVLAGPEGLVEAAGRPEADTVVSAMVGSAGLAPTLEAIRKSKRVALANKESLVAGGELIAREMARGKAELLPVDSEHSAIFQCLAAGGAAGLKRIILTGSGGPFLRRRGLSRVTVAEALRHPTWRMGRKVTIDSATLMNKGLEVIEAKWLFGLPVSSIEVMIHPQSLVHSLAEFSDGSILAQMGPPDMRMPIQYALTFPERKPGLTRSLDLSRSGRLEFERPDLARFPCLEMAREAAETGGSAPVALNAANEVAVQAFLSGRIGFAGIARVIGSAMRGHRAVRLESVAHVMEIDSGARRRAEEAVCRLN